MAEYMTQTQLKEIPDLVAERDFAFGMEKEEDSKVKKEMVDVQMKLLSVREISVHWSVCAHY